VVLHRSCSCSFSFSYSYSCSYSSPGKTALVVFFSAIAVAARAALIATRIGIGIGIHIGIRIQIHIGTPQHRWGTRTTLGRKVVDPPPLLRWSLLRTAAGAAVGIHGTDAPLGSRRHCCCCCRRRRRLCLCLCRSLALWQLHSVMGRRGWKLVGRHDADADADTDTDADAYANANANAHRATPVGHGGRRCLGIIGAGSPVANALGRQVRIGFPVVIRRVVDNIVFVVVAVVVAVVVVVAGCDRWEAKRVQLAGQRRGW